MAIRVSNTPTKKGNKYFFDVSFEVDGIRKRFRSKLFPKKEDAKRAERAFLADIELNKKKKVNYTFSYVIDDYVENKKRANQAGTGTGNSGGPGSGYEFDSDFSVASA